MQLSCSGSAFSIKGGDDLDNPFGGNTMLYFTLAVLLTVLFLLFGAFSGGFLVGKVMYDETDETDNQPTKSLRESEVSRQVAGGRHDLHPLRRHDRLCVRCEVVR